VSQPCPALRGSLYPCKLFPSLLPIRSGLQQLGSARRSNKTSSKATAPARHSPQPQDVLQLLELELSDATSASPVQASQPRGEKPKPKSMADLLAMLEDAPAGPIEIDTALLYSPQSSADLVGSPSSSSVGGRSVRSVRSPAVLKGGWRDRAANKVGTDQRSRDASQSGTLSQEFSLKAYRPSGGGGGAGEEGPADAFGSSLQLVHELLRSPNDSQSLLDWDGGPQGPSQRQQQQGRLGGGSAWAAASLPGDAPGAASQRQRQLRLDDVLAAGVAGLTAGLLQAGREARLQRLAQPRQELWERCARRKLEEEREELKVGTAQSSAGCLGESLESMVSLNVPGSGG
jgi:hypothetical protein